MRYIVKFLLFFLVLPSCGQQGIGVIEKPIPESFDMDYRDKSFRILRFSPTEFDLKLVSQHEHGVNKILTLGDSLYTEGRQLVFATNGGIFNKSYMPGGYFVNGGKKYKDINLTKAKGNFHLMPNGVFYLDKNGKPGVMESKAFIESKPEVEMGLQSGPILVINNELHPAFNEGSENTYVRNGVGVDDTGNIVFAISKQRTNFYDFAILFKEELQCKNALYLDGSISEMYVNGLSKEQEFRRKFATIFYLDRVL